MKKILIGIAVALLLSSFLAPTFAWYHVDGTEDLEYDRYGPRFGTLLIHLYADNTAEWAALKAGDLDITDWPLSKTIYDELTEPPYNDVIGIANYGPEYGLFILDLNSNNNQYLGNPPDPTYPNPVADRDPETGNPLINNGAGPANDQNPMSDVNLRRAIGYLIDRPGLIADPTIGVGFGFPMYTTMPPAQPKYLLDVYGDPTMPWAWSYDPAAAAALLDANGFPRIERFAETIRPNAQGTYTTWVAQPPTTDKWDCVNEEVSNDDEDYVHTSTAATVIANNPTVTVHGTGEDFNFAAWHGWWVRHGSTAIDFTFAGIDTAAIPGTHVLVKFNLGVGNHIDAETGLDGLVDVTINPGVAEGTYTLANVLFDNLDPKNHVYAMGGGGTYETTASILVHKDYILAGTLTIRVDRHTDAPDWLPVAPVCTNQPIDMSTAPPTVPTGCYEDDDAHTVHIGVRTTDATGTVADDGEVTIYALPLPVIADNPTVTVHGTGEDFNFAAWHGWWVRHGSTAIDFTFAGIDTAAIPGTHVLVKFNLGVGNHIDAETGLDGLVDVTINPGVAEGTYTLANVLFDNLDPKNHVYSLAGGGGIYETTASILVHKDYILAGTLTIRVDRHTDAPDWLPVAPVCTNQPIDMSTAPPTVPTGCYEDDDAHTVHIGVRTTDATGTVADDGEVTIYTLHPMQESYNLTDPTTSVGTIEKVTVEAVGKLVIGPTQTADDRLSLNLVIDGTPYDGSTYTLTTEYAEYSSEWTINPATGTGWTWNDLVDLEAGFVTEAVGDLPEEWRVTKIQVDIQYAVPTAYRYWDRNGNFVEEPDEYVELIFYIRSDDPGRSFIGKVLADEMDDVPWRNLIKLRVNRQFATSGACQIAVMINKDFHAYTGGWNLGVDPDHLILWSWDYYWHPGFCYNYGGHNHPDFNAAAAGVMYANDQAEAVMYAMMAQEAQCRYCLGIPLYCASGNKAFYKTNTGGNPGDASEGEEWENSFVNMAGYGIDNMWTMMNMHTEGPNGAPYYQPGVIDYGFKVPEIKMLNPVYASWLFDWNVLGMLYDSLLVRNASDLGQFTPWVAKYYELGTYAHPTLGTCTKIRFSIRDNFYWQDGTPLTTADVEFTFVELKKILEARGLPNPWWWSNVQDILSFSIVDPYTFEVLLGVKSYWATGWIGENIILPKHIWKPIAETGDPQADQPDPHCIGSSAWRFDEYNDVAKYVKLVANTPGSDVGGIISEKGFAFIEAKKAKKHVKEPPSHYCGMRTPGYGPWEFTLDLENTAALLVEEVTETAEVYVNDVLDWWTPAESAPTLVPPRTQLVIDTLRCTVWQFGKIRFTDMYDYSTLTEQYIHWTITIPHIWGFELDLDGAPDPDYAYPGCAEEIRVEITWRVVTPIPILPLFLDTTFNEVIYSTIKEDIAGSTLYEDIGYSGYPYKSQLPSPDIKVDIKDVALAAKGFGSYPGHPRWISIADINGDYKIDIKDIAAIAKMFGWLPPLCP